MLRTAWLVSLCAAATAATEGTEHIPLQQQALDEMIQRMNVVSGEHGGTDFDEALASKHDHNPHRHNPHTHNPHDHNPHTHNPHDHNPHVHCAKGRWNDSDECTDCPAGKYAEEEGSTSCKSCAAGKHGPFATMSSDILCYNCPKGKYATAGTAECSDCDAGKWGQYTKLETEECSGDCPSGKYSTAGLNSCKSCGKGRYGDTEGLTSSTCTGRCPLGKYSEITAPSCTSCVGGKYGATQGLTSSTCSGTCPGGKFSFSNWSSCKNCNAGTFSGSASTACTVCPTGKYQPHTTKNSCINCAVGKATTMVKQTWCAVCEHVKNEYQDTVGADHCKTCEAGKFAFLDSPDADTNSGTRCAVDCPERLDGFSLGDLLISSDRLLQTTMTDGGDTTAQQLRRVKEILKYTDSDGNGMLSREEIRAGIASHEVALDDVMGSVGSLWCNPLRSTCYEDSDEISEVLVYEDAKLAIDLLGNYQVSLGLATHSSLSKNTPADESVLHDYIEHVMTLRASSGLSGSEESSLEEVVESKAPISIPLNFGGPTKNPTPYPTAYPTASPTVSPTLSPTLSPTPSPTTPSPTASPTPYPTAYPTASPTPAPPPPSSTYESSEDYSDWDGSKVTILASDAEYLAELQNPVVMTTGSHMAVQVKCEMDVDTVSTTSIGAVTFGLNEFDAYALHGSDSELPVSKSEDGWDSYNIPVGSNSAMNGQTATSVRINVEAADGSKNPPGLGSYSYGRVGHTVGDYRPGLSMEVDGEKFGDGISALFWTYRHVNYDIPGTPDGVVFQQGDITAMYRSDKFVLQTPWGQAEASIGSNNDQHSWIHWGVSYDVNNGRAAIFRFGVEVASIRETSDSSSTVDPGASGTVTSDFATSVPGYEYDLCRCPSETPCYDLRDFTCKVFNDAVAGTCSERAIDCETAREDRARKVYLSNSPPPLQASSREHSCSSTPGMYLLPVHVVETASGDTDHICQNPDKTCDDCSLAPGDHCVATHDGLLLNPPNCNDASEYVVTGPKAFGGRIADVRIYSTALDCHSPLVQNYWEDPLATASLVAWFRFSTENDGEHFLKSEVMGADGSIAAASSSSDGHELKTFLHTPGQRTLVFFDGWSSSSYSQWKDYTTLTWGTKPFSNPLRCSFRNLIFFQDPFTKVSATAPDSSYTDDMCEDGYNSAQLQYSFQTDIQDSVSSQCVYLNGFLWKKDGDALDSEVTEDFEQRESVFHVGYSAYTNTKAIYLTQMLPPGSCPETCNDASEQCSNVQPGQQFSVVVESNKIVVTNTLSSTEGWTNPISITCKVPGARQSFCVKAASSSGDMGFKCATALFYDGTPLDLNPVLTMYGVEFGFTDTYVGETGFEVVRGDSVYSLANGVIVTKINYDMPQCGRTFGSIALADQQASSHPGLLYVYGVKAQNETWNSNIKSASYRVPWAANMQIQVTTQNSVGVTNVLVEVCHKSDPTLVAVELCWEGLTDKFGIFTVEISVSRDDWTEEIRYFSLRPVPRPLVADCDGLAILKAQLIERKLAAAASFDALCAVEGTECSHFEPEKSLVPTKHMAPMTRIFVDKTALTVWGKVIFDPSHVGGAECAIGGAKLTVKKSGETQVFETNDLGQFNFSTTRNDVVTVSVEYNNHTFAITKQVVVMSAEDQNMEFHDTTMNELSLDVVDELRSLKLTSGDLVFRLTSPTCVSPGFVLDIPDRLVDRVLPALLYDVTIAQGPTLDYSEIIAATPNTYCSKSMHFQIVDFFESMGNLRRAVDIRDKADSMEWVFRTGLCIYSTDFDNLPEDNTDTCEVVDNDFVYAEQGDTIDMQVQLFEFFPTGVVHGLRSGVGGSVTISEEVNGDDSECNPRNGIAPSCIKEVTAGEDCEDFGCVANITIMVGAPSLLSAVNNFLRLMEITAVRNPYNFDCPPETGCTPAETFDELDSVTIRRWVPVLGDYSVTDVAKTQTVSTGENMVFNVLHDPPGGSSSASWDEGSTMGFTIDMVGHSARDNRAAWTHSVNGGVSYDNKATVSPMGVGVDMEVVSAEISADYDSTNTWKSPAQQNSYSHTKGWAMGFRLGKAVSTSASSGNAGRASDLILGGGLELLFTEVIQVYENPSFDYLCIASIKTTVWEPAKLTTFLYSLDEIYDQMDRARVQAGALKVMAGTDLTGTGVNATLLAEQAEFVKNKYSQWVDIVDTYERSHDHTKLIEEQQAKRDEYSATLQGASDGRDIDTLIASHPKLKKGSTDTYSGEEIREEVRKIQDKMLSEYQQLSTICVDNNAMPDFESLASDSGNKGLTALAKECNHLGNHPGRILSNVFAHKKSFSSEGIPGTPLISGEQGEFDAINSHTDSEHPSYITFSGGGAALHFSHSLANAAHFTLGISQGDTWTRDRSWDVSQDLTVVALKVSHSSIHNKAETETAGEGADRSHQKGYSTSLNWQLSDPDPKDKFIVAVHDNLVWGTPVFRTIGGQSRCPAEPNTVPREEGAQILSIEPVCEGDTTSETECLQVHDGELATYKVKLLVNYQDCIMTDNTGSCVKQQSDEPYNFVLSLSSIYSCSGDDCEGSAEPILHSVPGSADYATCDGAAGNNGDLVVMVDGVVMGKEFIRFPRLPLGQSEFLLQVGRGAECYNYRDISLSLQSECEFFMYTALCIMNPPDLDDPAAEPFWQKGDAGIDADGKDWCSKPISSKSVFQAAWETPPQQAAREAAEQEALLAAQQEGYNTLKFGTSSDSTDPGLDLMSESQTGSLHLMAIGGAAFMGMFVVQMGMFVSVMRNNNEASVQTPESIPIRQYL